MRIARGLAIAFGIFALAFALHIVGGATDQGWLFAIAVALIFVSAAGFPVIAVAAGGFEDVQSQPARLTAALGAIAGFVFTTAALWAANGRAFAWWEYPVAMALVFGGSGVILAVWRARAAPKYRSTGVTASRSR